jgi:purine catabolism regulator
MTTSLRDLLAHTGFGIDLVAGVRASDPLIDVPLSWVHSSDLRDPTPWLQPGQLLLTDGAQFSPTAPGPTGEGDRFADDYVMRLQARGVLALGFATGIIDETIPPALMAACDARRFPLFEIDAKTPFIGIIRYVADVIADDRRAQLEWSLEAQRAVAGAALRGNGLHAILLELSRRLSCWVSLSDSAGNPLTVPGLRPVPSGILGTVQEAVNAALMRGTRSGARISEEDEGFTLQTLGQSGHLLGVLAVGTTAPLGPAENDLVRSVIGLASIALEQRRALDGARRLLRTGLFELLLSGVIDVADRTARSLWGPLPEEPVRVSVVAGEVAGQSLFDELEFTADRKESTVFFAERGDEILLVTQKPKRLEGLLLRHGLRAGSSGTVRWAELPRGLDEARRAARMTSREHPFVSFENLAAQGIHGLLANSGGPAVARRMLEPILELPAAESDSYVNTLRVWLEHNGAWDPAARALGIHRHTLRSRVATADRLLGIDLDTFSARSELWSALHLLD